jgi:hypothetical protein
MAADLLWTAQSRPGIEHVRLGPGPGLEADGLAIHTRPEGTVRLSYRLTTDAAWRTTRLDITATGPGPAAGELTLIREGDGSWADAGLLDQQQGDDRPCVAPWLE